MRAAAAVLCLAAAHGALAQPAVSAESAVVYDALAGRVLWEKNGAVRRFPASTTKIMTGLLLAENTEPNEYVWTAADAAKTPGSSLHLRPGEGVKSDQLLAGFMLRSGNDAGVAIAHHLAGSVEAFAEMMNRKAAAFGMKDTRFVNPHGLHDPGHFTTARDMAELARRALENDRFAAAVRMTRVEIERTSNQQDRIIVNRNEFLRRDSSAIGVKTGFTKEAGRCFVGAAERGSGRIITVILKSRDWLKDQEALNSWAFRSFQALKAWSASEDSGQAPIENGRLTAVPVRSEADVWVMAPNGARVASRSFEYKRVKAPVAQGQVVGELTIILSDGSQVRRPLKAVEAVPARAFPWLAAVIGAALGTGALGGAAYWWGQRKWSR
jgi:D-alanyl-D-alanine carboxypeptidase